MKIKNIVWQYDTRLAKMKRVYNTKCKYQKNAVQMEISLTTGSVLWEILWHYLLKQTIFTPMTQQLHYYIETHHKLVHMSQNYSPILELIQTYNSSTHGKVKEGSEKVVNFDVGSCYMGIHICKNWSVVNFWFVFNTLCKLYLKKIKNQVKLICVNTERIYLNFVTFG